MRLLASKYVLGALGAVIVALGFSLFIQTHKLTSCRSEAAQFKGAVEALGRKAQQDKLDRELQDKLFKEQTDANHARDTARLNATIERLRAQRAAGGGLSSPAPVAGGPDAACYDRAGLAAALRRLDEGVLGIVGEGAQAVVDLNSAREWAQGLRRGPPASPAQ